MPGGKIVWLASYPKSGNTWLRLLLGNLLGKSVPNDEKGDEEGDDGNGFAPVAGITSNRVLFDRQLALDTHELTDDEIDSMRPDVYRRLAAASDDLQFIKAHDCYSHSADGTPIFPADCSRAAIYLVRHPFDVAVSYAHHQGNLAFEKVAEGMCRPDNFIGGRERDQLRQMMLDWSAHYRSWQRQGAIPVKIVRYEDMRRDTETVLADIARFVGIDESDCAVSVAEAVEAARFERLQELEAAKGFRERPAKSQRFFRSGRSGEGRETLSPETQAMLAQYHAEVMQELGYAGVENP